ncbi:GNAT family N-acetyltransferase [Halocynthiibacter namhaensis]|uniref:GNAT family N-acetyltransferase n=1 Tax=Halocynthiibacter namhaensis TaxID=1290553 RepID=UPI0005790F34|nr:GNAT family N-acetyltransferase [Halocynthiibacter namhaensis]
MSVVIEKGDPRDPAATSLLQQSHALMQEKFPAESNHYLSIDDLCTPDIHFFVARVDGEILGCAALAIKAGYAELKSMFVDPAARGNNLGKRLLDHIDDVACSLDQTVIRLETGDTLKAAHRLYENHGYVYRGAFGSYPEDPISLFMEKTL